MRETIQTLEADGRSEEAEKLALATYKRLASELALALGQPHLRRAVAREAGAANGELNPEQLVANSLSVDGELARKLFVIGLAIAEPVLPAGADTLLSGAILRLGSGSRRPTILDLGIPKQVHGDPLARTHWVALTRAMGLILRQSALKSDASAQAEAWRRLEGLGFKRERKVPSRTDIELAILRQAKAGKSDGQWEDIKRREPDAMREAIRLIAGRVTGKLLLEQARELVDPDARGIVERLEADAALTSDLGRQIQMISELHRRSI